MTKQAAYILVYTDLKKKILAKTYAAGMLLPPEPELGEMYKVSRTTVRKAISLLVKEGYIRVKQGYGTEVLSRKVVQNLNRLTSISQSLKERGHDVGVHNTYIEKIPADLHMSEAFGIAPGTPVVCIHRIQISDGKPVTVVKNYILSKLVPGIESRAEEIVSLYEYLKDKYGIVYTDAKDKISAVNAGYEDAQLLEIAPKTALITINRQCFINNILAEIDDVKIVAEKYEFEIYMKGMAESGQ